MCQPRVQYGYSFECVQGEINSSFDPIVNCQQFLNKTEYGYDCVPSCPLFVMLTQNNNICQSSAACPLFSQMLANKTFSCVNDTKCSNFAKMLSNTSFECVDDISCSSAIYLVSSSSYRCYAGEINIQIDSYFSVNETLDCFPS